MRLRLLLVMWMLLVLKLVWVLLRVLVLALPMWLPAALRLAPWRASDRGRRP